MQTKGSSLACESSEKSAVKNKYIAFCCQPLSVDFQKLPVSFNLEMA